VALPRFPKLPLKPEVLQERYSRHLAMSGIGPAGQQKLSEASVLLVGAGGLGGAIAYYLAASGVGRLGLVDFDNLELSNLQRQILYKESDVGKLKVESAQRGLQELNSELDIKTYTSEFTCESGEKILSADNYDVIVDAVDNFAARQAMNKLSQEHEIPFVHGAVYRFEGEVSTFYPGKGPCYACLYAEAPEADDAAPGPASFTPGVIGTLEAAETIKLLLGMDELLVGRLLRVDLRRMSFMTLKVQRDGGCLVC